MLAVFSITLMPSAILGVVQERSENAVTSQLSAFVPSYELGAYPYQPTFVQGMLRDPATGAISS